ncbi:MAG: class I SAM-dependent methyltransferase [Cytophagaceae bacterium]|nr:class I SAM-dependent methyltransferase [Cytophagaceae bacterium]
MEPSLRLMYGWWYQGTQHQCPVCEKGNRRWTALKASGDLLCPHCGSLSRDRRLWQLLQEAPLADGASVLDFSPSRSLFRKLSSWKAIRYEASDLSGNFLAHHQFDITQIPVEDNSYDVILCYHILEHIENDLQAMQELCRVLRPGGLIFIQTPFAESCYENPAITSEAERLVHFGQEDHVRIYSIDELRKRLESCDFEVQVNRFLSSDKTLYYGLSHSETVLIATKKR